MIIKKKRIRNPRPYLYSIEAGDLFCVAVKLEVEDYEVLKKYGFEKECSKKHIPYPIGNTTKKNIHGYHITHKNLPKESRTFERAYHVVDWHGEDHYGVCYQTRECYPRTFINPKDIGFIIEEGALISPLMINSDKNMDNIQLTINILLEILGRCEIWDGDKKPVKTPSNCVVVQWEILRPGLKGEQEWRKYIEKVSESAGGIQQNVIKRRHEYLWNMSPDFFVLGNQSFLGYVVYGFASKNLYIFESNLLDNATYIFKGDWKNASTLTKTEILNDNLHEARLFHRAGWYDSLAALISSNKGKT